MKNKEFVWDTYNVTWLIATIVCSLMFGFLGWCQAANTYKNAEPVVKYVEVVQQDAFDTSVIEQEWCGGFTDGTIRMVGAWWYADGVVEDEQGQLWGIDVPVSNEDFLLLWIADNNTPNNTTDDIIIKTWREVY
jgi:hypothetical protein